MRGLLLKDLYLIRKFGTKWWRCSMSSPEKKTIRC